MIAEQPVMSFLVIETSDDGATWVEWTASLNSIDIARGGKRSGATSSVEVGTLSATLINAGDPLAGAEIWPNLSVRVRHRITGDAVYTGRLVDLATQYKVDKKGGKTTTVVTFTAADSVRSHAAVTRHGAVAGGGVGFETWAQRIIRLSASAVTPITPPADDSPIVRYAI